MQDKEIIRLLLKEYVLINIYDVIDDNLSVMDEELNVLWVNKNYHERLGKKYSEVIGKKMLCPLASQNNTLSKLSLCKGYQIS